MKKKVNAILILMLLSCIHVSAQEGLLSFGVQYKPIFASKYFGAGEDQGENSYFQVTRSPKWGHSFGMQIRRGINKMFSYETGINYIRRNYDVFCRDDSTSFEESFDFGLVGYEIPNQILIYIRLGENLYMNTATGISLNWFASDVASNSATVKFMQRTTLKSAWLKTALIANLGFELRTEKAGIYYLGASLTRPFGDIATTNFRYDQNLSTVDKEINLGLGGGIFTVDFRYYFHTEPIKKKVNEKKK